MGRRADRRIIDEAGGKVDAAFRFAGIDTSDGGAVAPGALNLTAAGTVLLDVPAVTSFLKPIPLFADLLTKDLELMELLLEEVLLQVDRAETSIEWDPVRRAVMAQDTGSAITGAVRADYFWGWG